jgi:prepilin-type N-terminal cleavage/methylation domain-containing protein
MRRLNLKKKLGFTLIEVLIVLALLGSAIALAVPNFMDALDGSKDKADAAQMDFLLNGFQSRQAPFYDSHTNLYDMLNPAYANADGTQDAEQALNLYLDDVLDPSSEVYIEGVQCVTREQAKMNDGTSVFKAESNNGKLWISCKLDNNRSNAEIRIPEIQSEDDEYSAGANIRWGDSLLYIGDFENLEARFTSGTCKDYQMAAGFRYDNHVHQDGDHKSHMGLVFNYLDDGNFFLLDLELKNGSKKISVYQVVDGSWSELDKGLSIGQNYNLPGNKDYTDDIEFHARMTVWNSVNGTSTVKLELAQVGINGGSYDEVFTKDYSVVESQKSSQYAFYIGEPDGNQLKQDGVIIGYKDINDPRRGEYTTTDASDDRPLDPDDTSTFQYGDVQIQLLSYPTFLCANEDGTYDEEDPSSGEETTITITEPDFESDQVVAHSTPSLDTSKNEKFQYQFYKNGSWLSVWDDSGDFTVGVDEDRVRIRVLRSSSVVAGPEEFEKSVVSTTYGTPRFTYNYNSDTNPITINVDDNFVEYLWVDGITNDSQPGDSETGTLANMSQISPAGLGSKTGWLWAREYDLSDRGDWEGTPWVGSNEFDDPDLVGAMTSGGYKVYVNGSITGVTIQYLGGSNASWSTSEPIITSGSDLVQARVMDGSLQISQVIQGNGFNVPEDPSEDSFVVTVKVRYESKFYSHVTVSSTDTCSVEYQTGNNKWFTASQNSEFELPKNTNSFEVRVKWDGGEKTKEINNVYSDEYTILCQ